MLRHERSGMRWWMHVLVLNYKVSIMYGVTISPIIYYFIRCSCPNLGNIV